MYMGRVNGVHQYKHGITRTYLNLDDRGSCYVWNQPSGFVNADFETELAKLEADLRGCGAMIEAPHDDHYIARKEEVLQSLGIQTLRIKIEPAKRFAFSRMGEGRELPPLSLRGCENAVKRVRVQY
jgi:hypothetical protein